MGRCADRVTWLRCWAVRYCHWSLKFKDAMSLHWAIFWEVRHDSLAEQVSCWRLARLRWGWRMLCTWLVACTHEASACCNRTNIQHCAEESKTVDAKRLKPRCNGTTENSTTVAEHSTFAERVQILLASLVRVGAFDLKTTEPYSAFRWNIHENRPVKRSHTYNLSVYQNKTNGCVR